MTVLCWSSDTDDQIDGRKSYRTWTSPCATVPNTLSMVETGAATVLYIVVALFEVHSFEVSDKVNLLMTECTHLCTQLTFIEN